MIIANTTKLVPPAKSVPFVNCVQRLEAIEDAVGSGTLLMAYKEVKRLETYLSVYQTSD